MTLTHQQRFDIEVTSTRIFAPLTLGCPSMLHATDYSCFEKSPQEKAKVATFKSKLGKTKHHKFTTVLHESF